MKRAFTLIEVLVVVAIIALLVSILLPSLKRAREQSKLMVCNAHLKEFGHAIAMYIVDSKEVLPGPTHYGLLKDLAQESLVYIFSRSLNLQVREKIDYYLASLKNISTSVTGNDLMKLGFKASPLYNLVLRDLLTAKLDGLTKTKEDEIEFTKSAFERLKEDTSF